jgi:uncharacterized protein (TIGR00661 family)
VLVAPLNWGLGHATRCIPIIRALEQSGFTPIIASDGNALEILRKEFPHLISLELPSYQIEYPQDGENFKWKIFKIMPKIVDAVLGEKKMVKRLVEEFDLIGIISDNRPGVFSKKIQSVFITHQLNVITGSTTWISNRMQQHVIKKFDECWVPDHEGEENLSGKLGHLRYPDPMIKYIGPLSRFEKKELPIKYDLMIILSGPEPQRTILEEKLRNMVPFYKGKVIFIKGKIEDSQEKEVQENVTYYNFMTTEELEQAFNESAKVLCRSGYTTIMDLAKLSKKAFFIPTPGQYEQEYLAKKSKQQGMIPFADQNDFCMEDLVEIDNYKGLQHIESDLHWKNLFCLFAKK